MLLSDFTLVLEFDLKASFVSESNFEFKSALVSALKLVSEMILTVVSSVSKFKLACCMAIGQ